MENIPRGTAGSEGCHLKSLTPVSQLLSGKVVLASTPTHSTCEIGDTTLAGARAGLWPHSRLHRPTVAFTAVTDMPGWSEEMDTDCSGETSCWESLGVGLVSLILILDSLDRDSRFFVWHSLWSLPSLGKLESVLQEARSLWRSSPFALSRPAGCGLRRAGDRQRDIIGL